MAFRDVSDRIQEATRRMRQTHEVFVNSMKEESIVGKDRENMLELMRKSSEFMDALRNAERMWVE